MPGTGVISCGLSLSSEPSMHQLTPAQQRFGFRIHALSGVLGMAVAFVVNLLIGPPWWAQWVLLGLGVGLLSHWWFAVRGRA